jgi:hypothetical protein
MQFSPTVNFDPKVKSITSNITSNRVASTCPLAYSSNRLLAAMLLT